MFFSKNSKHDLILILEVQSSLVRGSLMLSGKDKAPRIFSTTEVTIPHKHNTSSSYLIKSTLKAVAEVIDTVTRHVHSAKDMPGMPHKVITVHYILSSPWIVPQAKTISTTFPKPTAINRAYILDLVAKERPKMTASGSSDVRIIEEKIFDVRLNGYSVSDWESKETHALEVTSSVSIAGTRMIERFAEACGPLQVHGKDIHFHSALLLQSAGLKECAPHEDTYVLIHVHGELTDIAVVHHHSCVFFGSYPLGINSVIGKIAHSTRTDVHTAESLLTLHKTDALDTSHSKNVQKVVEDVGNGWASELRDLLKQAQQASSTTTLPASALISGSLHEDFFMDMYKKTFERGRIAPLPEKEIVLYAVAINNIQS